MMRAKPMILGDARGHHRPSVWSRRLTGLVAGFALLNYVLWSMHAMGERSRTKQALVDISRIEHAARLFRADNGRCPDDMNELVVPPGDRHYIDPMQDPWKQPYRLICPAPGDPGGVEVISGGPDRSFGGNDNISSL